MSQWIPVFAAILGIVATAGMALLSWSQRAVRVEGVEETKLAALEEDMKLVRKRLHDLGERLGKIATEVALRSEIARDEAQRVERQLLHLIERQDEMWQYFKRNGGNGPRT